MKLLALALCLPLFSCDQTHEDAQEEIDKIWYTQDKTTGLCFAVTIEWGEYDSGRGLANVPCEKVKHRIPDYVETE